jgi:hypothetical protein
LLGIGLGYTAELLLQSNIGIYKLFIIEQDLACLKTAMLSRDLSTILEDLRIKLIVGCDEHDLYVNLYDAVNPHFAGLKELQFLPWPASLSISERYYERVVATFRNVADTYGADRGNDPYDTLVAYEHFFTNIAELMSHPGAECIKDFFKDKPAIVVATGPSLKKNMHLLKEIENSALIISADASLRILNQHNIFPHMVTTVERPPGFDAYYQGLDHLDKTVFAAASFVHPSTLKAYTGPILFFHRLYNFMLNLGFEKDAITMGMSTANMAYEVARHMGCNPIILVGNDLAFDSTGNTHAPGFILGEKQPVYEEFDRLEVPGNIQPLVKTCDGWFACIKQYEKRISEWAGKLINATEGGARIRGSKISTLQEVIDEYCTHAFYPREALRDHMARWENSRQPAKLLHTVEQYIIITDKFIDLCRKLHPILRETLREIESSQTLSEDLKEKLEQTIPQVETILNNMTNTEMVSYFEEYLYSDIYPLLLEWQVINTRFNDPAWASAYRIKLAENFFGGLGQLCISLREVLLDGQKRLSALNDSH